MAADLTFENLSPYSSPITAGGAITVYFQVEVPYTTTYSLTVYLSSTSDLSGQKSILESFPSTTWSNNLVVYNNYPVTVPASWPSGAAYIVVVANDTDGTTYSDFEGVTVNGGVPPDVFVDDQNGEIGILNPNTGSVSVIGNAGVDLTDIAFNSQGELYGISFTSLYLIDQGTGAASFVGNLGTGGGEMNGLVFDSSGVLYAVSNATDQLYTINATTGQATALQGASSALRGRPRI
jgi:hypothetical protein